tara:strand:- start:288 stop:518 length:231 start_codon:yes stop_codon:yes gene_type:complete
MKVWLLVLFLHTPDMPSIKYQAHLFKTENECITEKLNYMERYNIESDTFKETLKTNAYCLPFDSFPIVQFSHINEI